MEAVEASMGAPIFFQREQLPRVDLCTLLPAHRKTCVFSGISMPLHKKVDYYYLLFCCARSPLPVASQSHPRLPPEKGILPAVRSVYLPAKYQRARVGSGKGLNGPCA